MFCSVQLCNTREILIPRGSFLLYLKFSAGYSVFSSAKSGNGFCIFVLSHNAFGVPPLRGISPGGKLFPLKPRVAGMLRVATALEIDFYSWGIQLFLKGKHVSRVCCSRIVLFCFPYFCLGFSTVFILRCQCRAGPLLCLMNICTHLISWLAQEGLFVSKISTALLYASYFFSITVLISSSFVSTL